MHQKEITQLQEDLKTKEDQLTLLKEKLGQTQQQLVKVEERLSSKYDYATVMDTLVTDENLKTSLEADKVDYHLQITNVRFSRREVKSKLNLKEIKMQKNKKVNRIAQNRVHRTSGGTPSTSGEEQPAVNKPKANSKISRQASARVYSTRPPAAKPQARDRAATAETSSRSNRKPSRNMDGDFRPRSGATVNSERPKD